MRRAGSGDRQAGRGRQPRQPVAAGLGVTVTAGRGRRQWKRLAAKGKEK